MADASNVTDGDVSSDFAAANRGALTTIFTPPGTCLTETTVISYITTSDSSTANFTTTKIFINHFSWGDPDCYPSTIATVDGYTRWDNGYYYSPGICPSGWTSACDPTTDALGFSTTMNSNTTLAMCCPSNWTCVGGSTSFTGHGCSTDLFAGQTLTSVWPAAMPTPDTSMPLPSQRVLTTWEIKGNTSALCDAIPVLWQNTDIQILSLLGESLTVIPTTISSSTVSPFTNAIPMETGTTSHTIPTNKSTLPKGVKIAIGAAIPIVIIALVLCMFFYFRRRNGQQLVLHEVHTDQIDRRHWGRLFCLKQELPSNERPTEMDAVWETIELENTMIVHEMPDTSIPEMSMRATSNKLIRRRRSSTNYLTDVVSQPAEAFPHLLHHLGPGHQIAPTICLNHESPLKMPFPGTTNAMYNISRPESNSGNENDALVSPLGETPLARNSHCSFQPHSPSANSNANTVSPISDDLQPRKSSLAATDIFQPDSLPHDAEVVSPISDTSLRRHTITVMLDDNSFPNTRSTTHDNAGMFPPVGDASQNGFQLGLLGTVMSELPSTTLTARPIMERVPPPSPSRSPKSLRSWISSPALSASTFRRGSSASQPPFQQHEPSLPPLPLSPSSSVYS